MLQKITHAMILLYTPYWCFRFEERDIWAAAASEFKSAAVDAIIQLQTAKTARISSFVAFL